MDKNHECRRTKTQPLTTIHCHMCCKNKTQLLKQFPCGHIPGIQRVGEINKTFIETFVHWHTHTRTSKKQKVTRFTPPFISLHRNSRKNEVLEMHTRFFTKNPNRERNKSTTFTVLQQFTHTHQLVGKFVDFFYVLSNRTGSPQDDQHIKIFYVNLILQQQGK